MKMVLILTVCLLSVACAKGGSEDGGPGNANSSAGQAATSVPGSVEGRPAVVQPTGPITFNLVQPVGQKSDYESEIVMKMKVDSPAPDKPPVDFLINMGMNLQTEVTAVNPDGTWTVENRISNFKQDATMNGQPLPMPRQAGGVEGQTYKATYDKSGRLTGVDGVTDSMPQQNARQLIEQMNPAQFLPDHPVRVGETWPINFDMPMANAGAGPPQSVTAKGTGKLTGVTNGVANIDYELSIEMGGEVSGTGSGRSTMAYDIEKARMASYRMSFIIDMASPALAGGGKQQGKGKVNMSMHMTLRN